MPPFDEENGRGLIDRDDGSLSCFHRAALALPGQKAGGAMAPLGATDRELTGVLCRCLLHPYGAMACPKTKAVNLSRTHFRVDIYQASDIDALSVTPVLGFAWYWPTFQLQLNGRHQCVSASSLTHAGSLRQ